MIATLHGLHPPAPSRARVLEIGCGAGANLLALGYASPDVRAVGIDLARTAIEEAKVAAEEVGITNVEFQHADVMDITDGRLGEFDYVISHGVYAWIPAAARVALLAAVKAHLAPDGVAYVSYNAHPGGYVRRLLREAALWHARGERPGPEQAEKARELFEFLEIRVAEDPYGGMLGMEVPSLAKSPQHRFVHDELSDFWRPVWFHEFASAAADRGLQYLAEASPLELWPPKLPGRGGAAARGDRRRRPDRARAVPGPAAVPALPLDDALPRGHRRRGAPAARHAAHAVVHRAHARGGRSWRAAAPRATAARRRAAGGDPVRGTALPARRRRRRARRGDHGRDARLLRRPARRPAGARAGRGGAAAGERTGALADRAPGRGHDAPALRGPDRRRAWADPAAAARWHPQSRRHPPRPCRRGRSRARAGATRHQPALAGRSSACCTSNGLHRRNVAFRCE